ncbi:PREDICTED: uncharacterized protein LOC104603202 isoform X2 [Nelumbo nucifera]|uniref:Uncharacterized protein LOC104603202 isoform X2 n=1 Tax=Nelumbo nucifera TaxID=4432 RepID=A0A1U8AER1_NELNU|nr:PREDICTED: uncharacterized protein LOC104603202 isoform X2 [Nelumbo nucifera]
MAMQPNKPFVFPPFYLKSMQLLLNLYPKGWKIDEERMSAVSPQLQVNERAEILKQSQSQIFRVGLLQNRDALNKLMVFYTNPNSGNLQYAEVIDLATGDKNSTKGQKAPKDELLLFNLLDIKLNWPSELQKIESSLTGKEPRQAKDFLDLDEVDLDKLYSAAKNETAASRSEEQLLVNKIESTEGQEFIGQGSLDLIESVEPSSMPVGSGISEDDTGYPFSGASGHRKGSLHANSVQLEDSISDGCGQSN